MRGVKSIVKNMVVGIGSAGKSVLRGEHMERWRTFNEMFGTNERLEEQIDQIYAITILEQRGNKKFDRKGLRKSIEEWLRDEGLLEDEHI